MKKRTLVNHLARISHESWQVSRLIRPQGFDSGPCGPPLRANLEQVAKHRVETYKNASCFLVGDDSRIQKIRE